jgi:hypothetical protein
MSDEASKTRDARQRRVTKDHPKMRVEGKKGSKQNALVANSTTT